MSIHGCEQTPEDFAAGTRIAEMADELGCLILLPRQKNGADTDVARIGADATALLGAFVRSAPR